MKTGIEQSEETKTQHVAIATSQTEIKREREIKRKAEHLRIRGSYERGRSCTETPVAEQKLCHQGRSSKPQIQGAQRT